MRLRLLVLGVLVLPAGQVAAAAITATPTAAHVVTKLKASGLPIGAYRVYNESSDPNKLLGRPGQYVGKVNFRDKRIKDSDTFGRFDTSAGGSVEVFNSKADAKRRFVYLKAITQSSPLFVEYDYLEGSILLRVSKNLTPTQAKKYEATLRRLF